jgi:YgiT-type zinc finger domain-containing protein
MPTDTPDPYADAQRALTAWHSTHPRATFAELERAVEEQLDQVRRQLLGERVQASFVEERPLCRQCGATMVPRAYEKRTLLLRGDEALDLERPYLTCPSCGEGFFPPG